MVSSVSVSLSEVNAGTRKSMHCGPLPMRVVFLDQQHQRQHAEANDREDLERIQISLRARLCLHHVVNATQGLMVVVGMAHPRMEQVIREPREPMAHRR